MLAVPVKPILCGCNDLVTRSAGHNALVFTGTSNSEMWNESFVDVKLIHNLAADVLEVAVCLVRIAIYVKRDEQCAVLRALIRSINFSPFPSASVRRCDGPASFLHSHAFASKPGYKRKCFSRSDHQLIGIRRIRIDGLAAHAGQSLGAFIAVFVGGGDNRSRLATRFVYSPSHVVHLVAHLHRAHVAVPAANFPDVIV